MIQEWRERIDCLDRQILTLVNRRVEISCRIARVKGTAGMPLHCPEREDEVIEGVLMANRGPLDGGSVETIFRNILSSSRGLSRCLLERGGVR